MENYELELIKIKSETKTKKYEIKSGIKQVIVGTMAVGLATAVFPFVQKYTTEYLNTKLSIATEKSLLEIRIDSVSQKDKVSSDKKTRVNREFLALVATEGRSKNLNDRIILAEYYTYLTATEPDGEQLRWETFLAHLIAKREIIRKARIAADIIEVSKKTAAEKAEKQAEADILELSAENTGSTFNEIDIKIGKRIYLQFNVLMDRDIARVLARRLVNIGWDVIGADKGGEQVDSDININEVRYYHAVDRTAAHFLAKNLQSLWDRRVKVANFSNSGLKASIGLIEIWISN